MQTVCGRVRQGGDRDVDGTAQSEGHLYYPWSVSQCRDRNQRLVIDFNSSNRTVFIIQLIECHIVYFQHGAELTIFLPVIVIYDWRRGRQKNNIILVCPQSENYPIRPVRPNLRTCSCHVRYSYDILDMVTRNNWLD